MPTLTPNLSLNKPIVNSATDEDLWGGQLNTNMDILDSESTTKTVNTDYDDNELSKADIKDISETTFDLSGISGAVVVDYENGHFQHGVLTGDITSLTINNFPVSGKVGFLTLELTQDGTGTRTIALSSAYIFSGGVAPTLTNAGGSVDILRFETRDAGTIINTFLNADMR